MPVKRARSIHSYHDADIIAIEWSNADELVITARLDAQPLPGAPETVRIYFMGIRNRPEIEAVIELARNNPLSLRCIEGFYRQGDAHLLGPLTIRCRSLLEI